MCLCSVELELCVCVSLGWWMCECHGNVGWAPPSYLKSSAPEEDSDSDQEQFLGLPESCEPPVPSQRP